MRVKGGYYVKFFEDAYYKGEYIRVGQDVPHFRDFGWQKKISSLRVYVHPSQYVLFYFKTSFGGYPVMEAWDLSGLGSMNDKIRSVKIIGKYDKFIKLYEHKNFEGKSLTLFNSAGYLGNFDKKVSSFSFTSDPKRQANP